MVYFCLKFYCKAALVYNNSVFSLLFFFSLSLHVHDNNSVSIFYDRFCFPDFYCVFFLAKKRNRCVARTNGMRVALNNHKNSSRKGRFLMHACEKNIGGIKNYFYVIFFVCCKKHTIARLFFIIGSHWHVQKS